MKLYLYFTLFSLVLSYSISAQCENAGFEQGNFNGWTGYTGNCCPIFTPNNGIITGQHTIVTGDGYDTISCLPITLVPPGASYSAQLGNPLAGSQAERLQYTFSISPESNLLLFEYAILLQDPGHDSLEQPRFEVQLLDSANNPIPCTYYRVSAGANAEGFTVCSYLSDQLLVKDWTTVGIDVSDYIGQDLTLDFATGDCSLSGHFGYAYIHASCGKLKLNARACIYSPDHITITAPPGFSSYLWNTGETTQSIEVIGNPDSLNYTCHITSVTGCSFDLDAEFDYALVDAEFTASQTCQSQLLIQNNSVFYNGQEGITKWVIDSSLMYVGNPFEGTLSEPGVYSVSMVALNDIGCTDTLVQNVQVFGDPILSLTPPQVINCEVQSSTSSILFNPDYLARTYWLNSGSLSADSLQIVSTESGWVSVSGYDSLSNCTVYDSIFVDANLDHPFIYVSPQDSLSCAKTFVEIQNTSITNSTNYVLSWSTDEGHILSQASSLNPYVDQPGNYTLTVIDLDSKCVSESSVFVPINDQLIFHENRLLIPDIITLSAIDGLNDCWQVVLTDSPYAFANYLMSYHVQIFNRWGDLLYESDSTEPFCPNAEDFTQGTYYYILQFTEQCQHRRTFDFQGNFEIK